MKEKDLLRNFDISRLKNATQDEVIKDRTLSQGFKNAGRIAGATDDLSKVAQPIVSGSDFAKKLAAKLGRDVLTGPGAKKALAVLGGPAAMVLSTAQDAMASDDVGLGSDQVSQFQNEEALLNNEPQNFADPAVSEQARRWQKIRGSLGE